MYFMVAPKSSDGKTFKMPFIIPPNQNGMDVLIEIIQRRSKHMNTSCAIVRDRAGKSQFYSPG